MCTRIILDFGLTASTQLALDQGPSPPDLKDSTESTREEKMTPPDEGEKCR